MFSPASEQDLPWDPRWELAERVAQSRDFQKAPRLRDFLLHVCRESLIGHNENLTEHQIGCSVFGRRPDYSPADDSIVRVQARQVRVRLAEYFRAEGAGETLVVRIPKGSYVPVFVDAASPTEEKAGTEAPVVSPPARRPWRVDTRWVLAGLSAALGIACMVFLAQSRRSASGMAADATQKSWLLAEIFDGGNATVVFGDPAFGSIQGMLNREYTLEDYLRPGYPEPLMPEGLAPGYAHAFRAITGYPLSSFTQVIMAERLGAPGQRDSAGGTLSGTRAT